MSIDTEKTDLKQGPAYGKLERADNDFALAWIRQYGRGRVFYCTIAHNPYVFWDAKMLQFYLAATQFVLGDLPAPTTPSGRLTPVIRAQETLGWRLALVAPPTPGDTLFDAIDRAANSGFLFVGSSDRQKVSPGIPQFLDPALPTDARRQIRLKLDAAGVRLLTLRLQSLPVQEADGHKLFEFAQKMGIETLLAPLRTESLGLAEKYCDEFDLKLALSNEEADTGKPSPNPEDYVKLLQGRSDRLGVSADLAAWLRAGVEPMQAVRTLGVRLHVLQLSDLDQAGRAGREISWGVGAGRLSDLLREVHNLHLQPIMCAAETVRDPATSSPSPDLAQRAGFFGQVSLNLARKADLP